MRSKELRDALSTAREKEVPERMQEEEGGKKSGEKDLDSDAEPEDTHRHVLVYFLFLCVQLTL